MELEKFRSFCLGLPHATEDLPFDESTIAFRIGGKIFALSDAERVPFNVNLKCDPERAVDLREQYEEITPGWHMNKKHWITVEPSAAMPDDFVLALARDSYELVFSTLKRADRERLQSSE